ncbi:MAG: hypothetical protein M3O22_03555 [Pseudomonadota bacterium]|nr:hypothetical protein [Pseudomonadota bacterium]
MPAVSRFLTFALAGTMAACAGGPSGQRQKTPSPDETQVVLPWSTRDDIAEFMRLPQGEWVGYARQKTDGIDCGRKSDVRKIYETEISRTRTGFDAAVIQLESSGVLVAQPLTGTGRTILMHNPADFGSFLRHWELAEQIRARCPLINLGHHSLEDFHFPAHMNRVIGKIPDDEKRRVLAYETRMAALVREIQDVRRIILEQDSPAVLLQAQDRIRNMYGVLEDIERADDPFFSHVIGDNRWMQNRNVLMALLRREIVIDDALYLLRVSRTGEACTLRHFADAVREEDIIRNSLATLGLHRPQYEAIRKDWMSLINELLPDPDSCPAPPGTPARINSGVIAPSG